MTFSLGKRAYTLIFTAVCVIAVVSVVSLIYLYREYEEARNQLQNTASGKTESEIQSLVGTIGKYMELPVSEVPTLATVTDVGKLPSIPFFANAKTGDKVLIYNQAAKAILYRPRSGKVIDVSVFDSKNPAAVSESTAPISVELRNGTTVTGITGTFEKKLTEMSPDVVVIAKNNAKQREYTDSLVIAGSAKHSAVAEHLAGTLNMVVSPLPKSEASTAADILIILGKDAIEAR